jgi:LmbE family N-acetylglucosaminyl deacetylase
LKVLSLMAHPDDAEFACAGTLVLLRRRGWEVHIATMTPGDVGSMSLPRDAISNIRRAEAAAAAAVIGAGYSCLEFGDLAVFYGEDAKRRACRLIRKVRPDLLITHPPADYMADHEETSRIAREAAFASTVPNWDRGAGSPAPCEKLPAVLYADPIGLRDNDGRLALASQAVDVTEVIGTKEKMLARHASQRDWLRAQHGEDEYLLSMKRWASERARTLKRKRVRYAEGFRRHLGHGFPKDDFLAKALGPETVINIR